MEPTQPQQPISADYLNQIAPQAPKKKIPLTRTQLIIFGILAVLLIVVLGLAASLGGNSKKPAQHLAARLLNTQTIVEGAKSKLKSSSLRAQNSNLGIYLADTNRDLPAPLLEEKIDVTKLDKDVTASETGEDVLARLEDARLNAVYDRTYAREIAYRLATIETLMRKVQSSTTNKDLKTFLTNALINLEPSQKVFADFNTAN